MTNQPTKDPGARPEDQDDKPEPFTTPVRLDLLVALLPKLEARDDDAAGELIVVAHDSGAIYKNFDWPGWKQGREYLAEPGALDDVDLDTCLKLLTVIVRQDRFCEGSIDGHVASGLAARIVRRIAELTRTASPGATKAAKKRRKK